MNSQRRRLSLTEKEIHHRLLSFPDKIINESFHAVVLQWTAKKCTRMYNARAKPLFLLNKASSFVTPVLVTVTVMETTDIPVSNLCHLPLMSVVYIQRHRANLHSISVICRIFKQAIVWIEHLARQQKKELPRGSTIIQTETATQNKR